MALISVPQAIECLKTHQPVALPTETVYGLAASIFDPIGLQRIFEIKERPYFDPLIIHVENSRHIEGLVNEWPEVFDFLAEEFWPGPLTLVAKKSEAVSDLITSGKDTAAFRSPKHSIFQEVLKQLREPLAAPSANRFKRTSPTRAQHVLSEFGERVPVVDGGSCAIGIESTILRLDPSDPRCIQIIRPGMVSAQDIKNRVKKFNPGFKIQSEFDSVDLVAPGIMQDHYQPEIPLYLLNNSHQEEATGYLVDLKDCAELLLSDDPAIAARQLYGKMRDLGAQKSLKGMFFRVKPNHRSLLWQPIMDRIKKASYKN